MEGDVQKMKAESEAVDVYTEEKMIPEHFRSMKCGLIKEYASTYPAGTALYRQKLRSSHKAEKATTFDHQP